MACSPAHVDELQTPALVLYKHIVKANSTRMLDLAKKFGVKLRPHFKTTKCVEAAVMQTGGSRKCMVVSTIPEAVCLMENGFDDILYGVPLSVNKIQRCQDISKEMDHFSVLVDSLEIARLLPNYPLADGKRWSVVVKVSCQNARAGVCHDSQELDELVKFLSSSSCTSFKALYAHSGAETYGCSNTTEVQEIATRNTILLLKVVERLKDQNIECLEYGIGCTPSCSNPTNVMSNLTEWHPGNYVLYDKMQMVIGSCKEADIGCFVVTTIIGHYPDKARNYMIVDCGFTALSLHGGGDGFKKTPGSGYGSIVGHPELILRSMSQEHGVVTAKNPSSGLDFSKYPRGSLLRIRPDHSCATCAMHSVFHIADENDKLVDKWFPVKGW